jgi:hypothetical protein
VVELADQLAETHADIHNPLAGCSRQLTAFAVNTVVNIANTSATAATHKLDVVERADELTERQYDMNGQQMQAAHAVCGHCNVVTW